MIGRRGVLAHGAGALTGAAMLAGGRRVRAQSADKIRLGVLNDQSSTYRDNGGLGSVACVRQAVADYAGANRLSVEVVSADHQNKADVAVGIARQWFDQGVDALIDIQNSAIALAVNDLVRQRDKVMLATNVATSDITGRACTPNTTHWAYDSYMLARVNGTAIVRSGGDTWFFIRADYAFGKALQDDATRFIEQAGGRVLGSVAMPFPSADFSSPLLQAQASGARVVAFANGGNDLLNCIKQANEFQLVQHGQRIAGLLIFINNVHSLGLEVARGLTLTETFYWDLNDRTRAFSDRVRHSGFDPQARPNMSQAAAYASALHYLKAAKGLGQAEAKRSGAAVVARMKAMPIEDDVLGHASLREDGTVACPAYLFEVKDKQDSHGPWDYYKLVATVAPEEAWRPMAEDNCPLLHG